MEIFLRGLVLGLRLHKAIRVKHQMGLIGNLRRSVLESFNQEKKLFHLHSIAKTPLSLLAIYIPESFDWFCIYIDDRMIFGVPVGGEARPV